MIWLLCALRRVSALQFADVILSFQMQRLLEPGVRQFNGADISGTSQCFHSFNQFTTSTGFNIRQLF